MTYRMRAGRNGFYDILRPDDSIALSFKPPRDGFTHEELDAFIEHLKKLAKEKEHGPS